MSRFKFGDEQWDSTAGFTIDGEWFISSVHAAEDILLHDCEKGPNTDKLLPHKPPGLCFRYSQCDRCRAKPPEVLVGIAKLMYDMD